MLIIRDIQTENTDMKITDRKFIVLNLGEVSYIDSANSVQFVSLIKESKKKKLRNSSLLPSGRRLKNI
ncbi:MAG: hypothetical protein H7A31_02985 [Thermotogae bacterium]|nr:hypothetical protein [Thermotogota bacterium]